MCVVVVFVVSFFGIIPGAWQFVFFFFSYFASAFLFVVVVVLTFCQQLFWS